MKKRVAVFGTMDTKGAEYAYLKEHLIRCGLEVLMVDTGITPMPEYPCEVTATEVARAGGSSLEEIRKHDRLYAFQIMGNGSAVILKNLCHEDKIDGAISLGGGQGTLLASMVMKALPIGFPKLIVSTIANLRQEPFEGVRDTLVMNPLVDVSGLNHILKTALQNAAAAMAGLVLFGGMDRPEHVPHKKAVGLTMFGVTTPCVEHVREILEANGYEPIVFHANGQGGKRLEEMIREGHILAVADITTGELTQELLGGNCSAGKDRLTAAPKMGIPQVIVPGAMELANFMPPSALPKQYEGRPFYMHNPNLKLLRANKEESERAGRILAEKVNASKGPVCVLLPKKGISQYDSPGGPLEDRQADERLFAAIKETLRPDIRLLEYDLHINDPQFAEAVAEELIKMDKKDERTGYEA